MHGDTSAELNEGWAWANAQVDLANHTHTYRDACIVAEMARAEEMNAAVTFGGIELPLEEKDINPLMFINLHSAKRTFMSAQWLSPGQLYSDVIVHVQSDTHMSG